MNALPDLRAESADQEPAFLAAIRLRARRRADWLRAASLAQVEPDWDATAISHAEMDQLLAAQVRAGGPPTRAELAWYEATPSSRELAAAVRLIEARWADDPDWRALARACTLDREEVQFLGLLAAIEFDPGLRRVFGYLNDDANACHATPWLAAALFGWPVVRHFTVDSALLRWRLARPAETGNARCGVSAPWVVDPDVVAWLADGNPIGPSICAGARFSDAGALPELVLYPTLAAEITTRLKVDADGQVPGVARPALLIGLLGPDGSGRGTLLAQLAAISAHSLIDADARRLLDPEDSAELCTERLVAVHRAARMGGSWVHWRHSDSPRIELLYRWLAQNPGDVCFCSASVPLHPPRGESLSWYPLTLPALDCTQREALWKRHSTLPLPAALANRRAQPADIVRAAAATRGNADPNAVCRRVLEAGDGELFSRLPCPYRWTDLVLDPGVLRHVRELEAQARLRWQVYEEWGFGALCSLGQGVTALLTGPSGVGKTMVAQVLAAELELELYRVDLAGVVNKYIGETEKRLKEVFDRCERSGCVLFFDEADALFGQRTQVRDAHDRYANISVDYLLQRMEQYDGLAILATNRKSDIDPAFLRRLRFVIDFIPPGPAERRRLWQLALGDHSGARQQWVDDIDWDFLAERLPMTGADIKSTALGAAFLARESATRITTEQILHAARREMAKHGVVLRTNEWELRHG